MVRFSILGWIDQILRQFVKMSDNEDEFMLNKDTDNNSEDSILKIPILKILSLKILILKVPILKILTF